MTDEASDDADRSSTGAAATVHAMDSNTAGEFAHVAPSIDPASVDVERAPSSAENRPSSGMVSGNNGVGVVANYQRQQYQQHMHAQQMQHMPPMHIPMATVMPSLSTIPAQQHKQGDHPLFAAMPLSAQASPWHDTSGTDTNNKHPGGGRGCGGWYGEIADVDSTVWIRKTKTGKFWRKAAAARSTWRHY